MPTATDYLTTLKATRTLIVGDPGAGKSTACAHLAEAPTIDRLFIIDLDDNWRGPLRLLSPAALAKIHIETLKDRFKFNDKNIPIVPGVPTAFPALVRLLRDWIDSGTGQSFGDPTDWTDRDALILDGCSGLAAAAMFYTLYANHRMGAQREIKDWANAIERFEGVIAALNAGLPCHIICTAHLARLTPEVAVGSVTSDVPGAREHTRGGLTAPENFWMRYPSALGQKLPPRLGGMFETVLQAKRVGRDLAAKRVLKTTPDDDVDVKLPVSQKAVGGIEIDNTKLIDIISAATYVSE
jgi:hypothetical protein